MIRIVHPGSGSGFLNQPGFRGQKGTGSRSRIRNTVTRPWFGFLLFVWTDSDPGFWWGKLGKNLQKEKFKFLCIYRLLERLPSNKGGVQQFREKNWRSFNVKISFLKGGAWAGVLMAILFPDLRNGLFPDPSSQYFSEPKPKQKLFCYLRQGGR